MIEKKRLPFLLLAIFGAQIFALSSASAATLSVTTTTDSHDIAVGDGSCTDSAGRCSLRAAIEELNALNNFSTVNVPSGTYTLNPASGFGQLLLTGSMQIDGAAASTTIIDGGGQVRVMEIDGGESQLTGLTLRNGNGLVSQNAVNPVNPGGILYAVGGLTFVSACVFTTTTTFTTNQEPGGGIAVVGSLEIFDTTVSNNKTVTGGGGGLQQSGGGLFGYLGSSINIEDSTFTGNLSTRGGGIGLGGASITIDNTTISGNATTSEGGAGIYAAGSGFMQVSYSTITNNTIRTPTSGFLGWGAGIRVYGGTLQIGKTLLTGNFDSRSSSSPDYSPDCGIDTTISPAAEVSSFDDNVLGIVGNKCVNWVGADGVAWDWFGNAALTLGPLANNGGLTMTHQLIAGDPIDSYSGDGAPAGQFGMPCSAANGSTDQRHVARPRDGDGDGVALCDTGAYEL